MGSVQRNRRRERSRHVGDGAILGRSAPPPVLRCIARPMERSPRAARQPSPRRGRGAARPPGTLRSLIKSRGGGERGGWPRGRGQQPPGMRHCRRRAPLRALDGENTKTRTALSPRREPTFPLSLQFPFTSHPKLTTVFCSPLHHLESIVHVEEEVRRFAKSLRST